MALSLGSSVADKVYLGATEVALAYLGATQVYSAASYLLDQYPGAAAAYSLRALSSGWAAGDVVRARRVNTPGEANFTASQVANGELATWALSGDAFVTTWYDQSGNANNATQATTTAQPKIVSAGTLVVGGIDFDGVNDYLTIGTKIVKPEANGNSVFAVRTASALEVSAGVLSEQDSAASSQFILGDAVYGIAVLWVNGTAFGTDATGTKLIGFDWDEVEFQAYIDGSASGAAGAATVNATGADVTTIGAHAVNSKELFFNGQINEVISYMFDNSANRAAIDAEIIANYGI